MERKQIKASFIVRAYNSEATIARTIKSALSQDFDAFEIVVIDDGSTDNTAAVALSFADARIRLIRQANKGITEAANAGIRAAEGDFFALLDADDEARPEYLSSAANALSDPAVDYAYGDYVEEYDGAQTLVQPSDPFKAPAGAFAWRRETMLSEGGFPGETVFPEYDILLRTWGVWRGVRIPNPVFVYHRSKTSITGTISRVQGAIAQLSVRYPARRNEIDLIRSYELSTHLLRIRPVVSDDAKLLFDWRNDEETRRASISSAPVSLTEHAMWVDKVVSGKFPGRAVYIVEDEGKPVGTVRSDLREDGYTEVSYTVAPAWRGKGVGKRMVMQFATEKLAGARLATRIKKGMNPASEAIARALGLSPHLETPSQKSGEPGVVEWR